MKNTINLSKVNWYNDGITEHFTRENASELIHPETMEENRLATAASFCKSIDNPYAEELIKRAGRIETFKSAKTATERMSIFRESAKSFGIILI